MSSPLVGKKATYVDSNSESGNRNESSHSLLMDGKDITDCLINPPCSPSRKKKEGKPTKRRKCAKTILDEQNKPKLLSHTYDSTVEQCYLNLSKDMVDVGHNRMSRTKTKPRKDRCLRRTMYLHGTLGTAWLGSREATGRFKRDWSKILRQ